MGIRAGELPMKQTLINLTLFKAGWVACVLLAARDLPEFASLAAAGVILIHLARVAVPVKEAVLIATAAVIGLAWESAVLATGLLQYPESSQAGALAPHWIVAMWMLFATTINHGFSWIKRNWMLSAAMGLIGGPMAFFAGAGMGAVSFGNTAAALALIGAGWMLLLPLLVLISDTIIDSQLLEPRATRASGHAAMTTLGAEGGPNA
jgi:hypothetical protein